MQRRETVNTTLGELIVAVTDEVMPFIRNPSCMYMVVSCIVSDLINQRARSGTRQGLYCRRTDPGGNETKSLL
jgi:hypothetical protein